MLPLKEKVHRYGIMGGTFDPIHYGHLVAAEAARKRFDLEKVIFVPSGRPPHKKEKKISDTVHRYLMTVLATITNPYFEVSRIEVEREGYSYAIDTVSEFHKIYGKEADIFFITGGDAILEILTWKKVEELLRNCNFIAATRPGFNLEGLKDKLAEELPAFLCEKIVPFQVPALAISSTDIRRRIENNEPIKYLLPEAVENYILKHRIYL